MSNVYFIGDLHFGHSNICKFRPFPTEAAHRGHLMQKWIERISKRDVVFVLGDAAFTQEGLDDIDVLPGRKILVRGNHDLLPTECYMKVFEEVYGMLAYKGLWLTHAPMHPSELFGRSNVHGHSHRGGPTTVHISGDSSRGYQTGSKATYFNTCCEHLPVPYVPMNYHDVMAHIKERIRTS